LDGQPGDQRGDRRRDGRVHLRRHGPLRERRGLAVRGGLVIRNPDDRTFRASGFPRESSRTRSDRAVLEPSDLGTAGVLPHLSRLRPGFERGARGRRLRRVRRATRGRRRRRRRRP
jgi:hypothetical protein